MLGLARSDAGAAALAAAGADVHRGSLEDVESLREGAAAADAVIHTAFNHDFSRLADSCELDRRAIEALGDGIGRSGSPLVVTSGLALISSGPIATERDPAVAPSPAYPRVSEATALELAGRGICASVVRLPPSVHGSGDKAFVPRLISIARETGVSAYVGDGMNRWPAVHRLDAARAFRLVLEKGSAGGRYHAVDDEGVPLRDIAAAIGRYLDVPVVSKSPDEAAKHFAEFITVVRMNIRASSDETRAQLGWAPQHPNLIEDLEEGHYF